MAQALRVLGVDPGLTRCGIGVVTGPAATPTLTYHACIRTDSGSPVEQRLKLVHDELVLVIDRLKPSVLAVEQVLFSKNVRTAMATGQAAGVALLAGAQARLPVVAYAPTEVKLTVAGSGSADKDSVGRMVAAQLGLGDPITPVDVSDALAVAITHLARARLNAAATRSSASQALHAAQAASRHAARGGWEAVLGDRIARSQSRPVRKEGRR